MTAPLLQLVTNPQSGSYDAVRIEALSVALAAKGYQVELCTSATGSPFQSNQDAIHVCVAGGDGTVRHVAAALASLPNPPSFSVFPMGTINLIAREWHAPRNPKAFAAHIADDAERRRLNIVSINDTHFVACASVGPDSCAVASVSESLKSKIGRLAYGVALSKVLLNWNAPQLTVSANGESFKCGALYIANGRYFAGPWIVAPQASLSEASLQVVMLKRARRRDFIQFLLATLSGRAASVENVKIIETSALSVEADRCIAVQIDGDEGTTLPAKISISSAMLYG